MKHPLIVLSLGLLGSGLPVSPAMGQSHGRTAFGPAGRGMAATSRRGAVGRHFVRMHHGRRVFAGSDLAPNYYPGYYSDYDYQDGIEEAPPPVVSEAAATPPPATPSKPPEALVMELRGDHWVRLTSFGPMDIGGQSNEAQSGQSSAPTQTKRPVASIRTQAPSELPAAVLVFRDGHREEIAKYTIVGTTIYLKEDFWSSGAWTRKIPIAELNLAATLQVNQERGANFSLPSRPSEVIVRW